ncbi:MAG: GyrI-like domain-containing protein [Alphaproteobacteria bacterium]
MEKIDFKKSLPDLYKAPVDRFVSVDVPTLQFAKVDGRGDPNTAPTYKQAIEWLYSVSYAMKFAAKVPRGKNKGKDYVVPPLEALWWADDPADFVARRKDRWCWTVMIMAPEFVDRSLFEAAVEKSKKKLGMPPDSLRFERLEEGTALQILHIGSYDDEGLILARLHDEEMPSRGLTFAGPHHEIYLSDPRKTDPAKLRTILRQPVKGARKAKR